MTTRLEAQRGFTSKLLVLTIALLTCGLAACDDAPTGGAGLDGTFGITWQPLATPSDDSSFCAFQSFHYSGQPYLYEFANNIRYDIADDSWTAVAEEPTFEDTCWPNGATGRDYIWVPRGSAMHRFSLADETWTELPETIPNGDDEEGAAVFDGMGYIWYHSSNDELTRYDPATGEAQSFEHDGFPGYDVYETRLAYDPHTNSIVFTGFENDRFLIFDIAAKTFSQGSANPGGEVKDNSCQDRSGGIYVGSTAYDMMYRYNIALDTWTMLPALPTNHDNNSTCVVSQDGWLYFATTENDPAEFWRLRLGPF